MITNNTTCVTPNDTGGTMRPVLVFTKPAHHYIVSISTANLA